MRNVGIAVGSVAAGLGLVLGVHAVRSPSPVVVRPAAAPTSTRTGAPSTTAAPPPGGTTAPPAVRSVLGTAENYGYGVLSVRVTLRGDRITDVAVASLDAPEAYSQSLAQQAIPMLRNEVLSAQTAQVDGISGATYTSEAYLYSLQSALDRARA